jgi:hypothetical protein
MAKNVRWSPNDFKRLGLIDIGGNGDNYVKASTQVAKKVDKLPSLLERAIKQDSSEKVFSKPVNKKVRNATKVEQDGIKFDSKLEHYMYTLLQGAGINFEFQKVFVLQEGFRYNGEAIRPIKSIVDFWLPELNMVVDAKGYANDTAPLKYKLLKHQFHTQGKNPVVVMPKNKKECDALINRIRYGKGKNL